MAVQLAIRAVDQLQVLDMRYIYFNIMFDIKR